MKKTIYIIIIFAILIILPGCTMNNKGQEKNPEELLRIEQLEVFDVKLFAILENVLGVHFTNYRLVTYAQENKDSNNKGNETSGQGQNQEETSKDKNATINISELADDNTIFENKNEPDWEKAKQYIRQASDIFVDIQIELKKMNIPEEEVNNYGKNISQLVYDVSNEDREKTIKTIQGIYADMYSIVDKSTEDTQIIYNKKLYYDIIQLLLFLEQEQEEDFNKYLDMVKKDMDDIKKNTKRNNEEYITQRINMIIDNIDYTHKNDARLKIVMLINCIPVLEFYEYN